MTDFRYENWRLRTATFHADDGEHDELFIQLPDTEWYLCSEGDDLDRWREIGQLWAASPDLLAACEKEEEMTAHARDCGNCWGGGGEYVQFCSVWQQLYEEAMALRQAALAKAKGEQ